MHTAQSQRALCDGSSPTFCAGRKVSEVQKALLWKSLQEDPECPSRVLLEEVTRTDKPIPITVRQTNRLRAKWRLSRKKGRPRRSESDQPAPSQGEVVEVTARLSFVGVHLFAVWMEQHGGFVKVLILLKQKIEVHKKEHPDEDFSLLHHKEQTLMLLFQALFFAPLVGIERLTEFDVKEHPLDTLIGRGYQSSTLTQFLGQLERIDAAEALMPALLPEQAGKIAYYYNAKFLTPGGPNAGNPL